MPSRMSPPWCYPLLLFPCLKCSWPFKGSSKQRTLKFTLNPIPSVPKRAFAISSISRPYSDLIYWVPYTFDLGLTRKVNEIYRKVQLELPIGMCALKWSRIISKCTCNLSEAVHSGAGYTPPGLIQYLKQVGAAVNVYILITWSLPLSKFSAKVSVHFI